MKEVHWAKKKEHVQQQQVSGVRKHKSMQKTAYVCLQLTFDRVLKRGISDVKKELQ